MKKTCIYLFVLFLAFVVACPARSQAEQAPARQHPYLFFSKADIPKLKERIATPELAAVWQRVQATALGGGQGGAPPQVICAGIAYNLTGDRRFADAGISTVMYNVTPGWAWIRPTDEIWYCDLGMGTRALSVAYGYDLLYDAMTEEQRAQCRAELQANVFAPYLKAHAVYDAKKRLFTDETGHWEWWTTCYFNWNAWVNGDIGLAGLAMLDEVPDGPKVVEMARASLKCMQYEYNQGDVEDGGYDEGPMYWEAGVGNAVRFYAALERVLNTDDGYFELPGVKKTMQYAIDFCAPDGKWVNFCDCPDRLILDPPSELYFLADRCKNPQFMRHLDDNSADWHARPFAILWRPIVPTPKADPRPPVRYYRDVEWAVLCSGGLYLPFKGGDLAANHGQWDANTMMLWVNGERMLNDPGYGNIATKDHNGLIVNGQGQHMNQEPFPYGTRPRSFGEHSNTFAHILKCGTVGGDQYLVSDASSCYIGQLDHYQRHVVLAEGGYVVVFDEVRAAEPSEYTVNWHTILATSATPEGQGLITGDKEKLYLAVAGDRPIAPSIVSSRFDWAFAIGSNGQSKEWRLFSVLAPNQAPKVETAFTADRASVTVNGKEHAFERTADGSYRYAAGEPVPPK